MTKYVAELKSSFPDDFLTGNISFGYLDYTYFPFFNDYLRKNNLRFGIILNHEKMRFELWLMGQNALTQKKYWEILKNTKWNIHIKAMPKYSVLEVCLLDKIDFNDKENMTNTIINTSIPLAMEIQDFLEEHNMRL